MVIAGEAGLRSPVTFSEADRRHCPVSFMSQWHRGSRTESWKGLYQITIQPTTPKLSDLRPSHFSVTHKTTGWPSVSSDLARLTFASVGSTVQMDGSSGINWAPSCVLKSAAISLI